MNDILIKLIKHSSYTRNELAMLSGLPNSYLFQIEKKKIKKIGREKIIAIGISLDLPKDQINEILDKNQHKLFSETDADLLFEISQKRRITGIQPLYPGLNFDTLLLSLESIPGDLIIVNDRPPSILLQFGYRDQYKYNDSVLEALFEGIKKRRLDLLDQQLKNYRREYFVCEKCLEEYIHNKYRSEKKKLLKHIEALCHYIQNPNYSFNLLKVCPYIRFEMKIPADNSMKQVYYIGRQGLDHSKEKKDMQDKRLHGFATDSKKITNYFIMEYENLKNLVYNRYRQTETAIERINEMVNNCS